MKYRWTDPKIDSASAAQSIEDFLESENFKVRVDKESATSYNVYGITETARGKRVVVLTVAQTPEGLEVDFKGGESDNAIRKASSLLSLFGAGALVVAAEERAEFYERIEKKLWKHMESKLSDSSSLS